MTMDLRQIGGDWLFKDLWGFKHPFSEEVSLVYGKAILICAHGGSYLAKEELAWVVGYFAALGFSEPIVHELEQYQPRDHPDDLQGFIRTTLIATQPDARLSLIYDGIRAASADQILDDGEIAAIMQLGETIGVSGETVERIMSAYAAEITAKMKREVLCFPLSGLY